MSTYAKMRKKRDHWKRDTVKTKKDLRYQRKENKRVKKERDQYKQALREAKKEIKELNRQNQSLQVYDKTALVFVTLQLFVAGIGFRAISRVLAVFAPQLGLAKTPCTQTVINWVTRLAIVRMKNTLLSVDFQTGIPLISGCFILVMDASIALGKGKIMTVLMLDARHYLLNPDAPSLQDVKCVAVAVADTWT